jgi:hypothetical protein
MILGPGATPRSSASCAGAVAPQAPHGAVAEALARWLGRLVCPQTLRALLAQQERTPAGAGGSTPSHSRCGAKGMPVPLVVARIAAPIENARGHIHPPHHLPLDEIDIDAIAKIPRMGARGTPSEGRAQVVPVRVPAGIARRGVGLPPEEPEGVRTHPDLRIDGERSTFLQHPLAVEEQVLGGARELPGERSLCGSRLYSEFAGILQGELRQRVSGARMLMPILCAGSMRSCLAHAPW